MAHYIIFGDSIGCGEGDPHGGWAKLLGQKYSIKNLSIDGATTNDYLKNFPTDIDKNLTIIIALGINDSAYNHQVEHCWVILPRFKQNLIQLIKLARKYTQKIIFVGPAPVDQLKVDPAPWAPDLSYKNNLIKQYSETIKVICQKEKLRFIDLFNNLRPDYIHFLDDGVHPNHAGHEMIFAMIKNNL